MVKRLGIALALIAATAALGAAPSLNGNWNLIAKGTPHGDLHMQLTLKQAERGKEITGELTIFDNKSTLKGEASDGSFSLKGDHGGRELSLTGKVKADGTLEGFLSTEQGDLTWTGTRAK